MTYRILAAATLSLGLGTAVAMAQTTTVQPDAGAAPDAGMQTTLPMGWDDAVGDAFFSDADLGTLRSQDEVQANWNDLSEAQQAQVRAHCATIDTAAADMAPAGDLTDGAAPAGDTTALADEPADTTAGAMTDDAAGTDDLAGDTTADALTDEPVGSDSLAGDTTADSLTDDTTTGAIEDDTTTGAIGSDDAIQTASIEQICDWIDEM